MLMRGRGRRLHGGHDHRVYPEPKRSQSWPTEDKHSDLNKDLSHHVCPMLVLAELEFDEFEIRLECFFCCANDFLKVGLYRTFCAKIIDFF